MSMPQGLRLDEYDGLTLWQNPNGFCCGDDAFALAAFASPQSGGKVLDMGTGNGILLVLLGHKDESLQLFGIEIMAENAVLAQKNLLRNRFCGTIVIGDMSKANNFFEKESFDYIIMNPPYCKAGEGRISPNLLKGAAKTEMFGTLGEYISSAGILLKKNGCFGMILPKKREDESSAFAAKANLFLKRREDFTDKLILFEYEKR